MLRALVQGQPNFLHIGYDNFQAWIGRSRCLSPGFPSSGLFMFNPLVKNELTLFFNEQQSL
jgi:hypothetical protein